MPRPPWPTLPTDADRRGNLVAEEVEDWRADHAVARALSHAFLSANWVAADLVAAGRETMGSNLSWLQPLVNEVLDSYPQPPADHPRELAGLIARNATFQSAAAQARRRRTPLRAVLRVVSPTRMAARPGPYQW